MNSTKILKLDRIHRELDYIFKFPLTIVSAAMGYGKTTSVKSYLDDRCINYAWISLVSSDGDEGVFWNKFKQAVKELNAEVGAQLEYYEYPLDVVHALEVVESAKFSCQNEDSVLVIDDYHLLENDRINRLLELLVQENISNFHIIIISRTRPRFNHINLISKGLCHYVASNKLAFTQNEIREYFNLMHYKICDDDLKKIFNYTRGWISAVYLMLLGLKQGYTIENININQLIEKNLFYNLNGKIRNSLLLLSVLDSFTLEQAAYVLNNKKIIDVFDYLLERNAFIEFDEYSGIYKIHSVFLGYLRGKLANSCLDEVEVCHRAGEWFLKQGSVTEAFNFYFRSGRIEELLKIMNEPNYISISYLGYKLQKKFYSFDKGLCVKYPFPFLQIARNFMLSGEADTIKQGIEIFKIMKEYFSADVDMSEKLKNRILGELEVIEIFISFNDIHSMVEHADKAHKLLNGEKSCIVFNYSEFSFGIPHFLYIYYNKTGVLKETLDYIIKYFPPPVFDGCGYGCEYVALAEYALETGNLDEVELYAKKAICKSMAKMQISMKLCASFTLMRLNLAKGDFNKAKKIFNDSKNQILSYHKEMLFQNKEHFKFMIDFMEGYLYACLNEKNMFPDWLRKGDFSGTTLLMQGMAFPCIIFGKAVMLSENWIELETLCEIFKERYEIYNNQLGIIHNEIYLSVARNNLYGIEKGIEVLEKTLSRAETDKIIMPFAENSFFILPMLKQIQKRSAFESDYPKKVINFCEKYLKNFEKKDKDIKLTERELQVIKLLSDGRTQREISDKLFVSFSTVKRCTESIYSKFDVNNKIAAIKKASELEII